MLAADGLLPGLPDPVFDSQRTFRAALAALARPGSIHAVEVALESPAPIAPATAALVLTLADFETPLWVQPCRATDAVAGYLRFNCGSPLVDNPAAARYALIHDAATMPALAAFDAGQNEYPDRSATLIVQVRAFDAGALVALRGPGIRESIEFAVDGLPSRFWSEWRDNAALFPRGVDVILVAGRRIAALPRTTQVET